MLVFIFFMVGIASAIFIWFSQQIFLKTSHKYRQKFNTQAQMRLSELFLFLDTKQLWWLQIVLCGLIIGLGLVFDFAWQALIIIAGGCLTLPFILMQWMKTKRLKQFDSQLPDMLQGLSSALQSGSSLQYSIRILTNEFTAPLSQEFSLLLREQRLGTSFEESLNRLYQRIPTEACSLTVSALKISLTSGGNLAHTLSRIANALRTKQKIQGKIHALTAQGKMQAWVMSLLPVLVGFALYLIDPQSIRVLWSTNIGWICLAIMLVLELIGVWLILKIVNIDI